MRARSIAVIGAGPIGLESALHCAVAGHDVTVFEREGVGAHCEQWGFARLFSPFGMNRSALGRDRLRAGGVTLPDDAAFLTGHEYSRSYLHALADLPELRGRLRCGHTIGGIARRRFGKGLPLGPDRSAAPLRLGVEGPHGEYSFDAEVVIDCTGTWGQPLALGDGNVPAPGERRIGSRLVRRLVDVGGARRDEYVGQRVLLVGAGYSAATALDGLVDVAASIDWVTRGGADPFERIPDDPLPERDRLARRANALSRGEDARVRFHPSTTIESFADGPSQAIRVELGSPDRRQQLEVDRILGLVGFEPDSSLWSELQAHPCYATGGPIRLAGRLLSETGGNCLTQVSGGADELQHPEPDFYVLGAKSYGRNSKFLIRLGLEQIQHVLSLIGSPATTTAAQS